MSKFKNLLLVVMVLFMVPMLAACSEEETPEINIDNRVYVSSVSLDPESKSVPLVRDTTYALKYSFEPLEATNKTVAFSSSNPSVATVDKYGVVTAVGSGSCYITIKSLDNKNALSDVAEIKVVNEKETLSKPTNPRFDGTGMSWEAVTVKSSTSFAPKYELTITRDGETLEKVVTTATYYSNFSYGDYSVVLRTLGDDENILYNNSDSTAPFGFTKLGNPTDLKIEAIGDVTADQDRQYVLSFTLANNTTQISDYMYKIIPVSGSATINPTQQQIWDEAIAAADIVDNDGKKVAKIDIPDTIANDPVYLIFGTKTDTASNVFGSGIETADRIQVGKLSAPSNLLVSAINDGTSIKNLLTWKNVPNADQYKLKVVYKNSSQDVIKTIIETFDAWGKTSFDMSTLADVPATYDSYEVFLYALGTSNTARVLMDSDSSGCAKQQLGSIKGEVNISSDNYSSYTITWGAVSNAQEYKVYISNNNLNYLTAGDLARSYNTTEPRYSLGFNTLNGAGESIWNIGDNYIKIVAVAEPHSMYEDSPIRIAEQKLIKLATPVLKVSKGVLTWDAVANAETYTINFGNGKTVDIASVENQTNYSYSPTSADFNSQSYADISMYAKNTDTYFIDSLTSSAMRVDRYNKIAKSSMSISDGNLTWGGSSGLLDDAGNRINASAVEIRIAHTGEEDITLKTIQSASSTLSIAEALDDLDGDGFYSFSLRAINTNTTGVDYVNGDWSDTIKTYQMDAPKNLRVLDGVLVWDKVEDVNIGLENTGIRYVIKLNDAELSNNLSINDTSVVLSNLSSSQNYRISIQTKITGTEYTTVVDTDDTYLINSLFSDELDIRIVPTPINLAVNDNTLSWSYSGSAVQSYTVYLYKSGESEPLAVEENITPSNQYAPSFDFSTHIFGQKLVTAGNYEFVVQAKGDNASYLSSYMSQGLEICKLATPVLTISDSGVISWTNSQVTLDNITSIIKSYQLTIKNSSGDTEVITLSTNSTTLSALTDEGTWCGSGNPLTITIKALHGTESRVYDSNVATYTLNPNDPAGSAVTVFKLPRISTSNITIDDENQLIKWSAGEYAQSQGYFNVMIYQKSDLAREEVLVNTTVQADASGNASYNISPNWSGMNYYIKIQQVGYKSGVEGSIIRRITSEFSEAKYFTRLAEATGVYLSSNADGEPVLNWQVLQERTTARYKVTLQKFDDQLAVATENQLTYYIDYDAAKNSNYSLNLYTATGYHATAGTGKTLADIFTDSETGEFGGEYQVYVTVVPNEGQTSVTIDGKNYLMMSSRVSKKQIMTIYSAPTINVEGSNVVVVNNNASSKGVKLEFREVTLSGSQYTPTGDTITTTLGANNTYFEVNSTLLTPNKLYQVTTQALGNGQNLVGSQAVVGDVLVSKLDKLEPNTVTPVLSGTEVSNTASFNGWYVKSGKVCWNQIIGATGYKIYMTYGATTKMVLDRTADTTNYSEMLSDMGFAANYGAFKLQFQVKGGETAKTEQTLNGKEVSIGYLSSDLSQGALVNKLFTPNGTYSNTALVYNDLLPNGNVYQARNIDRSGANARIDSNGEFDFGIRDGGGDWIGFTGATKYALSISGVGTTVENFSPIEFDLSDQTANRFVASDVFGTDNGEFSVSMYAIGNDWYGNTANPIYLTSDAQNSFKIIYGGAVQDLGVADGNITWTDEILLNNYDLKYKVNGASEYQNVILNKSAFDFEGADFVGLKGQIIDEVYVRIKGIPTVGSTAIEGYVNANWNANPLTKLMKLPDLGTQIMGSGEDAESMILYIDEDGRLAWIETEELRTLQTANDVNFKLSISREITLGENEIVQPETVDTENLSEQKCTMPRVPESVSSDGATYIYHIKAHIKGSGANNIILAESRKNETDPSILFLNSTTYEFSAGKLNDPKAGSFKLDQLNGKVRISWDLEGCGISIINNSQEEKIEADRILIKYYLNNNMTKLEKLPLNAKDYKFDDELNLNSQKGGTAFWQLGTFRNMEMSVVNSKGKAFGSQAIALDVAEVVFDCFESGTGTRNDPFVVASVEQLQYVFWLPEKYFRLKNDIVLPDLDELKQTYSAATTNIMYPAEFYDNNSGAAPKYTNLNFRGGFDGAGFAIKNYQVVESQGMYIWNALTGTVLDPIIMGDGSEYDDTAFQNYSGIITNLTVEVNTLDASGLRAINNGILVSNNAGVIYNCHIKGDDAKVNESGNRVDVVSGRFVAPQVINGTTINYCIGGIAGVVSDQKIWAGVLNYGTENVRHLYNQGFVGVIEKCTNMLDLKIYSDTCDTLFVGGIVGMNNNGKVIDCVNGSSAMDENNNSGAVCGIFAGGIAGASIGIAYDAPSELTEAKYTSVQYYSYNYGCKNYGTITSSDINSEDALSAAAGITGMMGYGYSTYSVNYGTITTDGKQAMLGGIIGFVENGAYIASTISAGIIRYNEFYVTSAATGETEPTTIYAGLICGGATGTGVIYNSVITTNFIKSYPTIGSTPTSASSYYCSTDSITESNLKSYSDVNNQTLEELQSSAHINDREIAVYDSSLNVAFTNLAGLYPRFKRVEVTTGEYEWSIEWTTEHA